MMEQTAASTGTATATDTSPLPPILFQQLCASALQSGTFLRRQTVQAVLGNLVQQGVDLGCFVRR